MSSPRFKIFLFLFLVATNLYAATTISNFADERYGFGRYGIYFINQPPVYYAEDYYLLYARRSYYGEQEINLNILFMEGALKQPFRPAYKALIPLFTEREQEKYRNLLHMHIKLRMLQDYLYLGRLYDMQNLYFFHKDFKEDLIKSLGIAEHYYAEALACWPEVKKYTADAFVIRDVHLDLDYLEDEMNSLITREVDWQFDHIIAQHLAKVRQNIERLRSNQ